MNSGLTAKSLAHPSSSSKSNTSLTRVDLPEPDFPIRRIRNVLQPLVTESKKVRRPSSSASDSKIVELPVEDDVVFGLILVYGEEEKRQMLPKEVPPKEVYQTDHHNAMAGWQLIYTRVLGSQSLNIGRWTLDI